jgi:hypothetical protein
MSTYQDMHVELLHQLRISQRQGRILVLDFLFGFLSGRFFFFSAQLTL